MPKDSPKLHWKDCRLDEIAQEVRNLFEPKGAEDFPYIGLEHIEQQSLALCGVGKSIETISTKKRFNSGDVLFGSLRPYFRKVVRPKFDGLCSTDITVIRAKNSSDIGFIFYLIANQEFIDYATKISSGTRMPRANWKILCNSKWSIPPVLTQQKIAAILSAYDDLIENNTQRIKILEEMAQALYHEWFVNFRFPGNDNVRMVESELGLVPEEWEIKTVKQILQFSISGGWGEDQETEIYLNPAYVIRGTNIPEVRYLNVTNCPLRYHTTSNFKSRKIFENDIIMEVSGGGKNWGVGRSIIVSNKLLKAFDRDVMCASFCKLIRINPAIIHPQIFHMILAKLFNDRDLEKYQTQSTGIKNFKFEVFSERQMVLIPKMEIQKQFLSYLNPIINCIQAFADQNVNLRRTRDLLLPKLISGEMDVSELNIRIPEAET